MTKRMVFEVIVHGYDDAVAAGAVAREANWKVCLHSAAGAGCYAGAAWWRSLVDAVTDDVGDAINRAVLDCDGDAGAALAALRAGVREIRFQGADTQTRRLRDIAGRLGACIDIKDLPATALDLRNETEPREACRRWLRRLNEPFAST